MIFGIERIDRERARQMEVEGFSAEHDDELEGSKLARAGHCYDWHARAIAKKGTSIELPPPAWPLASTWWKPSPDPVRNWEKAGALYRAEADRAGRHDFKLLEAWSNNAARICGEQIDKYLARP